MPLAMREPQQFQNRHRSQNDPRRTPHRCAALKARPLPGEPHTAQETRRRSFGGTPISRRRPRPEPSATGGRPVARGEDAGGFAVVLDDLARFMEAEEVELAEAALGCVGVQNPAARAPVSCGVGAARRAAAQTRKRSVLSSPCSSPILPRSILWTLSFITRNPILLRPCLSAIPVSHLVLRLVNRSSAPPHQQLT